MVKTGRIKETVIRSSFILLLAVGIMACGIEETPIPLDAERMIFLLDKNTGTLRPVPFETEVEDVKDLALVNSVLSKMIYGVVGSAYEPSVDRELAIEQVSITNGNVMISFTEAYYMMPPIKELQTRSAIVRSLTSFEEFSEVEFFVAGKSLEIDGVSLGGMSKNDVLLTYDETTTRNEVQKANVYYPDGDIQKLQKLEVVLEITPDQKIEEIIINRLDQGELDLLPNEVELLNIYTHDRICFVDFSGEFLMMNIQEGLNERLIIYSIVNSLVELEHVSMVQILIDGNVVSDFNDVFMMNRLFERNQSLIADD